jgi:transcriptional regulator with XRE-family HTH domain
MSREKVKYMKNLQHPVHKLRMLTNMSMMDFADTLGVAYMTVYRWENKDQKIALINKRHLYKLAIFYYIQVFKEKGISNKRVLTMCRGALHAEFGNEYFSDIEIFNDDMALMKEYEKLND